MENSFTAEIIRVSAVFYSDDGGRIMSDKLEKARLKVTEADEQIVPLLVKRLAAVEEIGRIKQEEGIGVKDSGREKRFWKRSQSWPVMKMQSTFSKYTKK